METDREIRRMAEGFLVAPCFHKCFSTEKAPDSPGLQPADPCESQRPMAANLYPKRATSGKGSVCDLKKQNIHSLHMPQQLPKTRCSASPEDACHLRQDTKDTKDTKCEMPHDC